MKSENSTKWLNSFLVGFAIAGLAFTFLLQEFAFVQELNISDEAKFVVKKVIRVLLNDFFMLIFIAAWFKDPKVTRLAIFIEVVDGLVLLPLYLVFKLSLEGTSEISAPLLSQFHRLIVNPTLMILLIPAVYFQKRVGQGR